jgi:hypothetical protein
VAGEEGKKRRLPVLQQAPEGGETPPEERPASHWAVAAGIITLLTWLLCAGTANAVLQRTGPHAAAVLVSANVGALFVAAAAAGLATGRFGLKATGRHAIAGALVAAGFGWAMSFSSGQGGASLPFWAAALTLLAVISASGAAVGYRLGRRLRRA